MTTAYRRIVAAAVLVLSAAALHAGAMDGNGSPHAQQGAPGPGTGAGHPCSLMNPSGSAGSGPPYAVYYPPGDCTTSPPAAGDCMASPRCIPFPSLKSSSPFFGTPLPSGDFRQPNPCDPAPYGVLVHPILDTGADGPTASDPTPLNPFWSPIESLQNLRAAPPNQGVLDGSIARTPFNPPTYAPPAYAENPFNPGGAFGSGRFHVDNQDLVQEVDATTGTNVASTIFRANGDPRAAEGEPDDRFVLLGDDGYLLGRFEAPVSDGPGYDLRVNIVPQQEIGPLGVTYLPYGTFCVLGATDPQGPFTLVHSAFLKLTACDATLQRTAYCPDTPSTAPPCPAGVYCFEFDLSFFYTPLRTMAGLAQPGRLDYFLVVNSHEHTPYLKTDFRPDPDNAGSCLDPLPACPDASSYPSPNREMFGGNRGHLFEFEDTSVRFGYPLWWMWLETELEPRINPADTSADPIVEWAWRFDADPYAFHPIVGQPEYGCCVWAYPQPYAAPAPPVPRERWQVQGDLPGLPNPPLAPTRDLAFKDVEHEFVSPGIFPVCHTVHTEDQYAIHPITGAAQLTIYRQSDPPGADFYEQGGHRLPRTDAMLCKPVTLWNIPPIVRFSYYPDLDDLYHFQFLDETVDYDWLMPPDYEHYLAPLCADCPPDGIQRREWTFEDRPFDPTEATTLGHCMDVPPPAARCEITVSRDGDVRWDFVSREAADGWTWDPTWNPALCPVPMPNTVYCNAYAEWLSWNPGNTPDRLHSDTIRFTDDDLGATVTGWAFAPDTKILAVLDERTAILSKPARPSYTSLYYVPVPPPEPPNPRYPLRFALSWPYDEARHDPLMHYDYPRPGHYLASLKVCDHDWLVRRTPPVFGTRADGSPQFAALHGDPLDVVADPAEGRLVSTHACGVMRKPVFITNHPPQLSVPPNFVVRPGSVVTFRVVGTDADKGQQLTLRLCPGQPFGDNLFPPRIDVPGKQVEQVFTWSLGDLPIGRYGPICFQVSDGIHAAQAQTTIYVAVEATDSDGDGVVDLADNCPGQANRDQQDADRDGVGDACAELARNTVFELAPQRPPPDPGLDPDADGVPTALDNCPQVANGSQRDLDGDGLGDLCDRDADEDGVANVDDNCPLVPNPQQLAVPDSGLCFRGAPGKNPDAPAAESLAVAGEPARAAAWVTLKPALLALAILAAIAPGLLFVVSRRRRRRGGPPPG